MSFLVAGPGRGSRRSASDDGGPIATSFRIWLLMRLAPTIDGGRAPAAKGGRRSSSQPLPSMARNSTFSGHDKAKRDNLGRAKSPGCCHGPDSHPRGRLPEVPQTCPVPGISPASESSRPPGTRCRPHRGHRTARRPRLGCSTHAGPNRPGRRGRDFPVSCISSWRDRMRLRRDAIVQKSLTCSSSVKILRQLTVRCRARRRSSTAAPCCARVAAPTPAPGPTPASAAAGAASHGWSMV